MPTMEFLGAAYSPRSRATDIQRCVNLYPELREAPIAGKAGLSLYGTPGLARFCTLAQGPIRGLYTVAQTGRCFAVGGHQLVELHAHTAGTVRGTLASNLGPVSMADNGQQLIIVDGSPSGYVLTLATNAWTGIASPGFYGADSVQFLDGFFVLNRPGTGQFYLSLAYDGLTYDATQFATAEGAPDLLVSILADHRELWLFGQRTTEVWFNTGAADFPLSRLDGAFLEHGCAAPRSVAKLDNSVFWLGQDAQGLAMVWRAAGYQPARVSTHAVEHSLRQQAGMESATAYTYQQGGHSFYVLNGSSTTWVFDAGTGLWHERQALLSNGSMTRHRAESHAVAFGHHLVGDMEDGRIYRLDLGTYTDDGVAIVRERLAASIEQEQAWILHHRVEIEMETGTGLDGGVIPGTMPAVLLDWSDDNGGAWSAAVWGTAGAIGARQHRVIWRRLGRSRQRHYRLRSTDPVPIALVGANVHVTLGGS